MRKQPFIQEKLHQCLGHGARKSKKVKEKSTLMMKIILRPLIRNMKERSENHSWDEFAEGEKTW